MSREEVGSLYASLAASMHENEYLRYHLGNMQRAVLEAYERIHRVRNCVSEECREPLQDALIILSDALQEYWDSHDSFGGQHE